MGRVTRRPPPPALLKTQGPQPTTTRRGLDKLDRRRPPADRCCGARVSRRAQNALLNHRSNRAPQPPAGAGFRDGRRTPSSTTEGRGVSTRSTDADAPSTDVTAPGFRDGRRTPSSTTGWTGAPQPPDGWVSGAA